MLKKKKVWMEELNLPGNSDVRRVEKREYKFLDRNVNNFVHMYKRKVNTNLGRRINENLLQQEIREYEKKKKLYCTLDYFSMCLDNN